MSDTATTPRPGFLRRCENLVHDDIWRHAALNERTLRGRCYAFLRIASICVSGTFKNKIFVEAAALGYYSLISLGPLVSLAIIISSFFVQKNGEEHAAESLNQLILYIAPPVDELSEPPSFTSHAAARPPGPAHAAPAVLPENGQAPAAVASPSVLLDTGNLVLAPDATSTPLLSQPSDAGDNPEVVKFIDKMIKSARSGKVGVLGLALLVFICIQLIITIENTFNSIWGVRRGRSLANRIVMYWAIISLGTLVGFTAGTLFSAVTLARMIDDLPNGLQFLKLYGLVPHLISFFLVAGLLTIFYRFIPNTAVRWRPALLGGFVATLFLTLNNFLSFLYVSKVISSQSLYGSIGIFPVLMFGLYIFWLLVLLGGQLTYAVQNANYLTDDRLWNQVSPRVRRLIGLAAFLQVSRAFIRRELEPSVDDLVQRLRVPANILNECLTRLCDLHLLSPIDALDPHGAHLVRYQPGRVLDRLTLGDFQRDWDKLGNCESESILTAADPIIPLYLETLTRFEATAGLQQTFRALLADEKTKPPFPTREPPRPSATTG
jgi:membrane protein